MDKDKASVHDMSETEYQHAKRGHGGKGSGIKSRRTRRRQELIAEQERHAMDKPKPLEEVSDGDLSEIKKDPVWKTWLGKKRDWDAEDKEHKEMMRPIKCTNCGKTKPRILYENPLGVKAGTCDDCFMNPKDSGLLDRLAEGPSATDEEIADWEREQRGEYDTKKKSWEVWLDNVTKPIPDSKGGRGSFQHCINANQDKRNPGGWCNRIEANIGGGKKKAEPLTDKNCPYCDNNYNADEKDFPFARSQGEIDRAVEDHHMMKILHEQNPDYFHKKIVEGMRMDDPVPFKTDDKLKYSHEGEEEEVKISMYEKLRRIKDRLQAHNKARQTKIDKPKDWWDHSKVGTNTGWDDDPMNKPSYFQARMEEERQKREKKKAGEDHTDDVVSTVKRRKRLQDYFENKTEKVRLTVAEYEELLARARAQLPENKKAKEADDKQYEKLTDKTEEPESDYYMDAGGNPQLRLRGIKVDGSIISALNSIDQEKRRKETETVEANTSDANKTDYFVEEIRSNIIYHNKILPLIGMIAGQAARGMGKMGKKVGQEILEGASDLTSGVMQGIGDEAEEEEQ